MQVIHPNNFEKENENNTRSLEVAVASRDSCVFIGNGLSIPLGYPSGEELIKGLKEKAKTFIFPENSNVTEKSLFYKKVSYLKKIIGEEKFNQFLSKMFDRDFKPDGKPRVTNYRDVHHHLINIPFKAYITTNYDTCLDDAITCRGLESFISCYPKLDFDDIRLNTHKKIVYHLHGIIFPDRPLSFKTVILTNKSYLDAYEKSMLIPNFLEDVYSSSHLVFLGYDFENDKPREFIEKFHHYQLKRNEIKRSFGLHENHFTHFLIKQSLGNWEQPDAILDREIQNINSLYENCGLITIMFQNNDKSFRKLDCLIERLAKIPDQVLPSFLLKDA